MSDTPTLTHPFLGEGWDEKVKTDGAGRNISKVLQLRFFGKARVTVLFQ
jgi:hypothetical protein